MKPRITKWLLLSLAFLMVAVLAAIIVDRRVGGDGSKYLFTAENVPEADAIIVFGAYVFPDGKVSDMLADRLNYGYKLYKLKKAPKIVVSGDHGQKEYDEVNSMRKYLQSKGVPREDIFMDHAGFDTYSSLYRAREVFEIKKAILVSQEFHVVRGVYIARELGIEAFGVASDSYIYPGMAYYRTREVGARLKAFAQAAVFKPRPKFLGKAIPIWKSGELTDDGR